jgi:DNA-binding HxlR family transcriptional regulator
MILMLQELREELENWGRQARELQTVSRRQVADLPPDTQTRLTATELEAETLLTHLDQLEAEHKRAKTLRYEFQVLTPPPQKKAPLGG